MRWRGQTLAHAIIGESLHDIDRVEGTPRQGGVVLERMRTVNQRMWVTAPFALLAVLVIGAGVFVLVDALLDSLALGQTLRVPWTLLVTVIVGTILAAQLQVQIGQAPVHPTLGVSILMLAILPPSVHPMAMVAPWSLGVLLFLAHRMRDFWQALIATGAGAVSASVFVLTDHALRMTGVWQVLSLGVAVCFYYVLILATSFLRHWAQSPFEAVASLKTVQVIRVANVVLGVTLVAYVMNVLDAWVIPWVERIEDLDRTPFVLLMVASLCFVIAQRSRYLRVERQLRGVVDAAIELPQERRSDFLPSLEARAGEILRARTVETRSKPPGRNEIGAAIVLDAEQPQYLVASHKIGGTPFSWEDDRALTALAGMAMEAVRQQGEVAQLERRANSDPLTGLPNYTAFQEALRHANEERSYHAGLAVLFIDIDHFKRFNDTHGHQAGDRFLRAIGQRLAQSVSPGDLVSRIGGDEFVVIMTDLDSLEQAAESAERHLEVCSAPLLIEGQEVRPVVSAGLAYSSNREADANTLVEDADRTMLLVKRSRSGDAAVAQSTLRISSHRSSRTNAIVARAIAADRLTLAYQPIVDLKSGRIWAFEALLRYVDPEIGPISPPSLVARAKSLGLMNDLTRQVVVKALLAAEEIASVEPAIICMTVNLELNQVARDELGEFLLEQARAHPTVRLCVELNERSLRYANDTLRDDAIALQEAGILLALDDYGSDDSSVGALVHFPMDVLKIDKSLVEDLGDRRQREVVRALQGFGDSLGSTVIIEGVECAEMSASIRELGVTSAQGYYYGRPISLVLTLDRLRRWGPRAVLG